MVKAVIFDLGKVLVDFDYSIAVTRIAARSRISLAEMGRLVAQSPLLLEYETGLLTSQQFFQAVCDACGFEGTFDEFGRCFGDIFVPIEPMVELHAALRRRGLPTYIFSNTNDLAIQHIRRSFPFFANFDGYVLSYEHRAMKPGAKLYEAVEAASGRKGAELLYLDDRPENIEAGAARGWQVILQESPEKTRAALQQLGLLNHA
jgi:FMN phosphatase YigB (HAD superfamily)